MKHVANKKVYRADRGELGQTGVCVQSETGSVGVFVCV